MVFNSLTFLIFFALFLPTYFLLRGRQRMWLCLLASYLFYGWWDWRFLGLVLFTTTLDYSLGIAIDNTDNAQRKQRLLWVSVASNLSFLGFFKYFNFFADSFAAMMRTMGVTTNWHTLHIILPIGISFYTFQSMSYTIDVYKKEIKPERDFFRFATFVALFPQLVAGPIVRARQFLPQFQEDKKFEWRRIEEGLAQVIWGFFKKVAIADSLAPFVDQVFGTPQAFGSLHLLIGVVFYSFQIYCDFSGYSNIACGVAQMMGFDFPWNFRTPYFSKNFSEFWTRWHISLSSWLRDYLYVPLGGNRDGTLMTYRNNMLTMLIGGLWHGANWTFVFWGFLHGLYLIVQRIASKPFGKVLDLLHVPALLRGGINIGLVYFFTCFAWIFFRAPTFSVAWTVISGIGCLDGFAWEAVVNKFQVLQGFVSIGLLLTAEIVHQSVNLQALSVNKPIFRVASFAFVLWLIEFFGTFNADSFIYFQF
jgi:alginate O-acetyltransferase complex protein AlgI